jgi:hypothetical protein
MRFRRFRYCLVSALTAAAWSHAAHAEHSVANFPDTPGTDATAPVQRPVPPASPASSKPDWTTTSARQTPTSAPVVATQGPEPPQRDSNAKADERRRKAWLLSIEGVTHAPIDMGVQLGVETPQGLRLFGGYGWVPGSYMNLLTGIAANASGNSYAQALLEHGEYAGKTWRVQAGFRPFRAIGLYADVGYARVNASGALDLAASGVPQLAMFGGGYSASTRLDMWLVELGYQGELADRLVLALALGMMGTLDAKTSISAVGGAPTNNMILRSAANQADSAFEKYGFVPTLTLRLGFDLI